MPFCTDCGAQLETGERFCSQCGRPLGSRVLRAKRIVRRSRLKIVFMLLILAAAAVLITWLLWPGETEQVTAVVSDASQFLEIELADGTAIVAPPGALPAGTTVFLKKIDPKEAPPLTEGFEKVVALYDFSANNPLQKTVTLRFAVPELTADSDFLLSRYRDGRWEAVSFTREDRFVLVETDELSLWGWVDINMAKLADWLDAKIMEHLDIDRYISEFKESTGISALMELGLETTPASIGYDDSRAKGLISASAVPIEGDRVRLRVRNETKFYLHVSFEGVAAVEARRGGYLSAVDKIYLSTMTPEILRHQHGFPAQDFLLLPEGTAEFTAAYEPGKTITVHANFSDTAALFSSLDPAMGLVPIVDLEVVTTIRDLLGEGSTFVRSLSDIEKSLFDRTMELLDFVEAASRTGVLLGEKAVKTLANMLLMPAVVEFRKEHLEGRIPDILQKGPHALDGVSLLFEFPEGTPGVVAEPGKATVIGSWYGVDEYGEEGYLQFQADGVLHIASPSDGYWTTFNYRLEKEGLTTYLYDNYYGNWGKTAVVEFKENRLILTDPYDEYKVELIRISNETFRDVINWLEYNPR